MLSKYSKIIDENKEFGLVTKIKTNTPDGEFEIDIDKIKGLDYSKYREMLLDGKYSDAQNFLLKKSLDLSDEDFKQKIEKGDSFSIELLTREMSKLISIDDDYSKTSSYINIIEENEDFGLVKKLKIDFGEVSYTMSRNNVTGERYLQYKNELTQGKIEQASKNLITKLINEKENFSISDLMLKPFYWYKRLDNAKSIIMGDGQDF